MYSKKCKGGLFLKDTLKYVYTVQEASEIWGVSFKTVIEYFDREAFKGNEAKKSGETILVTYEGMQRIFGDVNEEQKIKNILSHEIKNDLQRMQEIFGGMNQTKVQYNLIFMRANRIRLALHDKFTEFNLEEAKKLRDDVAKLLKSLEMKR